MKLIKNSPLLKGISGSDFIITEPEFEAIPPVDIFKGVKLKSFTATKQTIHPFEFTVLNWEIEIPEDLGDVKIILNATTASGVLVKAVDSKVVSPKFTTVYSLLITTGGVPNVLDKVVKIEVDLDTCKMVTWPKFETTLIGGFIDFIEEEKGLQFRNSPGGSVLVDVKDDIIEAKLLLRAVVEKFPNPEVTADIKFGLTVINGIITPVFHEISIDISVPRWVWILPGAIIALPIIIANKKKEAREKIRAGLIDAFKDIGLFLSAFTDGEIHSVIIREADQGTLHIRVCSVPRGGRPVIEESK